MKFKNKLVLKRFCEGLENFKHRMNKKNKKQTDHRFFLLYFGLI
ncbi:hypothetical protein LEP1GSC186_3649 [Leptospira noguchii serovar Autumnalis str. ZUN142]|uniref:Uncharacterized protein n=3 Tax=Leptospira noguchii TaxID=28182 RepID=T0FPX8_9LEPT|nr:hypothetical protein LEP1GSC186_3649 [Leptospira noguchii serovar Autumnalis str. ZUN142]EMO54066.1 hypothetical protein LEP1GSC172_3704 [Leptospira noguchii]EQA71635.1 hypothetical protein LEP1GSC059_2595 [Leptospira noguchii serovar Panama str. CZ214]